MSADGEKMKSSAALAISERLDWQSELDSAMSDIDSRLQHPRRRANDSAAQPTLPQLGQVELTNELLDEIAWRVSEQIRRSQATSAGAPAPAEPAHDAAPDRSPWRSPPQWPDSFEPESKPATEAALVIRLRWPLFRWPFKRRRRQLTSIAASLTPR